MTTRSLDAGLTWEPPKSLGIEALRSGSPFGKIATLADGTVLLPTYDEPRSVVLGPGMDLTRPDAGCSYLVRSRDDGQTWEEPTLVGVNLNETALLTYGNRNPPYRIEGRLSRDGGRSWLDPLLVFSGHLYGYDLDAPRPTDLGYPSTAIVATPAGRVRVTMYYSNPSLNRPANWEKRAAEARYLSRDYVAIAISWREDDLITAI